MYGYHEKPHQFLKIYFYNPLILKKAYTLLQNGHILNKIYQPHEAHIPFILQFMIDYNLHGMSFINISNLKYRYDDKLQFDNKIPNVLILPTTVMKISLCEREIDVLAEHILNASEKSGSQAATNPGIASLWEDERLLRRNYGESSQISQCLTQNRLNNNPTNSHFTFKQLLIEKLILSSETDEEEDSTSLENVSVYPAETPDSENFLDASVVEKHSPFISQASVIEKSQLHNETSIIFDEEAEVLLNALNDLKANAKELDNDSVLSQKEKDVESDDDEADLSMPLASLTTPLKMDTKNIDDDDEENNFDDLLNSSFFDKTLQLPQLDGDSCFGDVEDILVPTRKCNKNKLVSAKCSKQRIAISVNDIDNIMDSNNCKVYVPKISSKQIMKYHINNFKSKMKRTKTKVKILSNVILEKEKQCNIKMILQSKTFRTITKYHTVHTKSAKKCNLAIDDIRKIMGYNKLKVNLKRFYFKILNDNIVIQSQKKRINIPLKKRFNSFDAMRYLDGANDSSSDESSQNINLRNKRKLSSTTKKVVSNKYRPLNITKTVSPKKSNQSKFRANTIN